MGGLKCSVRMKLSLWQALKRAPDFPFSPFSACHAGYMKLGTPKGQSKVSVLERCPFYRGHHDYVTSVRLTAVLLFITHMHLNLLMYSIAGFHCHAI